MAKIDLKFLDDGYPANKSFIQCERVDFGGDGDVINISGKMYNTPNTPLDFTIQLDKSTAIKFAKTLRTEINKIQ